MGRVKLEIKKIEKNTSRQVTYSKRKMGIIKKAFELSVLCDIDLALVMFSPSDRLCHFSGQTRIEDVFRRYLTLPDQEIENAIIFPDQSKRQGIQNKEYLLRILEQIKAENDSAVQSSKSRPAAINSHVKELEEEVRKLQQLLQESEGELRKYEPDPGKFTSVEEFEVCENHLNNILTRVSQRRENLSRNIKGIPLSDVVQVWSPNNSEPKQAHMIFNSAHQTNQLSFDRRLLKGSSSHSNQEGTCERNQSIPNGFASFN